MTRLDRIGRRREAGRSPDPPGAPDRPDVRTNRKESAAPRPADAYARLVERVRAFVAGVLPERASVAVATRGDGQLLQLGDRATSHFPRQADGTYAGHYPADDAEAVRLVDELAGGGVRYLLFPSTALWWLSHYRGLARHLETRYRLAAYAEDLCAVFDLAAAATVDGGTRVTPGVTLHVPVEAPKPVAPPPKRAGAAGADAERYELPAGFVPRHTLEDVRAFVAQHDWGVDFMFDILPPAFDFTGMRVLDLGCGITLPALHLVEKHRVAEYHSIDPDPGTFWGGHNDYDAWIGYKHALACYYPGRVNYYSSVAEKMPFPDDHFDFVFALQTTEHVQDIDATCREVRRVLKPGGYFYARHHNFYSWCGHHQGPYFVKDLVKLTPEQAAFQDWKHLDMVRDWSEPHHLNCITPKQLEDACRASFRVVTWRNLYTTADRGLTFLTPQILKKYEGRFDYEDLASTGILVLGKKTARVSAAPDRGRGAASGSRGVIDRDEEAVDITDNGERVTHLVPNDCYYAHLSIYRFALRWAAGRRVLDAGSGSGYGSAYLAERGARAVVGWELSPKGVEFSRRHFRRDNLRYECVDLDDITPAAAGAARFDMVYSSNVLEHLTDVPAFLSKCVDLLTDDSVGVFAVPPITSPALRHANLTNFYHLNIWSPRQWRHVLDYYFEDVEVYSHLPSESVGGSAAQLDFSSSAGPARVTEEDFDFRLVDPEREGYDLPAMTSVFVARRPRRARSGGMAGDLPVPFFIDDSFSREPATAPAEVGPEGARTDIVETSLANLGPVAAGHRFCQKLVARHDRLTGIALWVATYCRVVRSTMRLTLADESMTPLREVRADTAAFADNEWQTLFFEPVERSRGRTFFFCVETDATAEAVTLWANAGATGILAKNGSPAEGGICFRSYYQTFPLRGRAGGVATDA